MAPPPPPPPPPAATQGMQWLGPRVSFSLDDAAGGGGREAASAKPSGADFEFFLGGCAAASMLPADELFSGGKLVPLRVPAVASEEVDAAVATKRAQASAQQPETPRGDEEEPKIPARRWQDLLRLRKQQASSSDPPPEPEPSLSLPLLRESDEKASSSPAPTATPVPTPPPTSSQHHSQLPPKIRLSASQQQQAPPAADSPRLNAAGKVVFNGLGRSASSPSSLAGAHHHRGGGGGIERSYSAHVGVAPVLNVPVCSLRGSRKSVSVFGIDRLFSSSSSSAKRARAATKKGVTAAAAAPH